MAERLTEISDEEFLALDEKSAFDLLPEGTLWLSTEELAKHYGKAKATRIGELTTKKRKSLPDESFALPGRRYPIHDRAHAANALARAKQNARPDEMSRVHTAVCKRYPDMPACQTKKQAAVHGVTLAESGSEPFELLRIGNFEHSKHGEISVSAADLDKAAANFAAATKRGHQVPIDYDHAFAEGRGSKAAGWVREVFRKGSSLFGRVEWTPPAAEAIKQNEYRFFSAEFDEDWKDESGEPWGFTLLSGALTNRPFLKGMTPVSLSEAAREIAEKEIAAQASWLDLRVTAPKAEIRDVEKKGDQKKTVTLSEEDHTKLVEASAKVDALSEQVKTLGEELTSTRDELGKERFLADIARARREGRVDLKEETTEKWQERYKTLGRDTAKEILFEMPPDTIPVKERGGASSADEVPEAPVGAVHKDRYVLHERAKKLAEEKDIAYDEAVKRLVDSEKAAA